MTKSIRRSCLILSLLFFVHNVLSASNTSKPTIELWDKDFNQRWLSSPQTWERPHFFITSCKGKSNVCVFTSQCIAWAPKAKNKVKIAWLAEPRVIDPGSYRYVEANSKVFDRILTFDRFILENFPDKARFVHAPGFSTLHKAWIHPKNKLCSFVLSNKRDSYGHKLRWQIFKKYKDRIDIKDPSSPKEPTLKNWSEDYRYMVIVENSKQDYYFSEKILDCILTGTIPIYWGSDSIRKFFDMEGIIMFNTLEELDTILEKISAEDYQKRLPAIRKNYTTALTKYPMYTIPPYKLDKPVIYDSIWPHVREFFGS